ncbi:hypothetical protein OQA88_10906 [Cercophora sp. LCS_1]
MRFPSVVALSIAFVAAAAPGANQSSLTTCLASASVPFLLPANRTWPAYATSFNARLPYSPAAVVLPTTPSHVSSAVRCASAHRVPVQAKSGGHSYASFSLGGDPDEQTLVVNLENFQSVVVDNATYVAAVGAGVRLGNLALAIYAQGKRALAHGTCPGVGIGGHFTHGGYGYSSRAYGLAMEQMVAADVVLSNGTYVRVSSTEFPDVFWALRGAADSFGIITTFYLRTVAAPPRVVQFSYSVPAALASPTLATATFLQIQAVALNASVVTRQLGFGIFVAPTTTTFSVDGTYLGSMATFNAVIAPALLGAIRAAVPVARVEPSVQQLDWISSLTAQAETDTLAVPAHGYSERGNFFAKSVSVAKPFGTAPVRAFFDVALGEGRKTQVEWFSLISLYGGPDSQIGLGGKSSAAYAGFDDLWVVQNYGSAPLSKTYPSSGITFINKLNDAMTDNLPDFAAYPNYVDPTYTREQAHKLYYGEELLERLRKLKAILDPNNVFRNPQSILSAPSTDGAFFTRN